MILDKTKTKKIICLTIATVFSVLWVAVPILAAAQNVEETEQFENYEILGYDEAGNVVLSNDDYEDYMAKMFAERAEKIAEGKDPDSDAEPVKKK